MTDSFSLIMFLIKIPIAFVLIIALFFSFDFIINKVEEFIHDTMFKKYLWVISIIVWILWAFVVIESAYILMNLYNLYIAT